VVDNMDWINRFGDERIRGKASRDERLKRVLNKSLEGIYSLLEGLGRQYKLEAVLTDIGENLIRMRVNYKDREQRDRIWDEAARIIEAARADQGIDILCGIYRLIS
jgi:hypothetical protein